MVTPQGNQEVEFRFYRAQARQIFLVGSFNEWNRSSIPMRRGENGEWTCRLRLPPGVYQFKYLADDEWFIDYAAFGLEPGPFGWNSTLVVERSALTMPKPKAAPKPTPRHTRRPVRVGQPAA